MENSKENSKILYHILQSDFEKLPLIKFNVFTNSKMAPRKRSRNSDGTFRTSGGSLTGGTGDVKPQFMTLLTPVATGSSDYSVARISLPQLVLGGEDTATIFEFLRVDWYINVYNQADAAGTAWAFLTTNTARVQDEGASLVTAFADLAEPGTFGMALVNTFTTGTSGAFANTLPISVDLTDGNGNGILVATNSIFIVGGAAGDPVLSPFLAKVLYRQVNVGIREYVGIVASSQGL